MLRRPPISTRTDTRFPYTTRFRSIVHAEPFHHRAAADIAPPCDRPDFIVGQIFEGPRRRAACCLAGETGAPAIARQPPADLDLVRHGTGVAADHAAPADQPRIFAAFERPEAMAMFGLVPAHPVDPRCGRFDIERRAESRHDLGIAANPLKGRAVFVAPRPRPEER